MNPWIILTVVLAWGATTGGAYIYGRSDGADIETAAIAREDKVAQVARDAAQLGAADAISKIEIKNVTIKQTLQKEIYEKPVYRDCRNSPDGLRAINDALGAEPVAAGSGKLPATGAAH
jgi:hypothetical protein